MDNISEKTHCTKEVEDIQSDLNSMFSETEKEFKSEIIKLSEEEKLEIFKNNDPILETKFEKAPRTRVGKFFNFIKNHVRPDIGLITDKSGSENENLLETGDKLKEKIKIGIKLTFKF